MARVLFLGSDALTKRWSLELRIEENYTFSDTVALDVGSRVFQGERDHAAKIFVMTAPQSTRQTGQVTELQGHVRVATSEDLEALLNLDRANPVGHERTELLSARLKSGECFLFEREGQAMGYLIMRYRSFFGRDFVELLAVAAPERRTGIASLLLHEALTQSSTRETFTSTNESNRAMIALLYKHNWTFSGQLEGIDEGDPEFVFYKRADSADRG